MIRWSYLLVVRLSEGSELQLRSLLILLLTLRFQSRTIDQLRKALVCYFETGFAFYSRDEINNTCGFAGWREF